MALRMVALADDKAPEATVILYVTVLGEAVEDLAIQARKAWQQSTQYAYAWRVAIVKMAGIS